MVRVKSAPEGIRTPGTWRRRPVLYPAELRTQVYEITAKQGQGPKCLYSIPNPGAKCKCFLKKSRVIF